MKLFDGSENYELGKFICVMNENEPTKLILNINKNTTVSERLLFTPTPKVVLDGRPYTLEGVHDLALQINIKAVGNFVVFANSVQKRAVLQKIIDVLFQNFNGTLDLNVGLTGDDNPSQTKMAPFTINMSAQPGNWSIVVIDREDACIKSN